MKKKFGCHDNTVRRARVFDRVAMYGRSAPHRFRPVDGTRKDRFLNHAKALVSRARELQEGGVVQWHFLTSTTA
jgi:hypothetical protein